ncbi:MAG: hypothetical protein AAF611_23030 [Bacteroidota bacterium]
MANVTPNSKGKISVLDELDAIKNWKTVIETKGVDDLNKMFTNSGNYFSLNLDNAQSCKVHIYFGCDEQLVNVQLYIILANYDEKGLDELLGTVTLKSSVGKLETLQEEIKTWNTESKRKEWLKQVCDTGNMLQAFVIDATDFMPGHTNECHFALKETSTYGLQADLVVVNTQANGSRSILKDMARPVPPYNNGYNKGYPSTDKANFRVLKS